MKVKVGLRVVRGPDWEGGNEDGGEGYVGTVVAGARADSGREEGRHDVATVQWDVGGERHVYRCGAEGKYDLRVIDSAPAGVVHKNMECSGCGSERIAGCVWRCVHCLRYYLCTPCYMKDRHSVWHHFIRIDSPEKPGQRTRVQCRYKSSHVSARGVFVGARVVRGGDWRWSDQDGGAGREGTVVEICGRQSETSRSVAVVEWRESGVKNKYRLGHKGKVDVQCKVAGEGGHCYLDHHPLLGSESKSPSAPFIAAGDRVTLEMDIDLLKSRQEEIGAWDPNLVEFLGKAAVVTKVTVDEVVMTLALPSNELRFNVVKDALKKLDSPAILPGDVIRVIDDIAEVHRLQMASRGWEDDMALSLGQVGRVVMLDEDGYPILKVNGYQWVMDCCCLQLVPGEKPENEMAEVERSSSADLLLGLNTEPTTKVMADLTIEGRSSLLEGMLKKYPEKVNTKHSTMSLLHWAAMLGKLNCVQVLLKYKANIKTKTVKGESPLHAATNCNHYQVAKLLVEEGCDVNVKTMRGATPLHIAAISGYSRLLDLFLQQPNCDVNARTTTGETALHYTCQKQWPAATRALVLAGTDLSISNEVGFTAFFVAVIEGFYFGMEVILQSGRGTTGGSLDGHECAPLHLTAIFDKWDILHLLVSMPTCDLDGLTGRGQTALYLAVDGGNTKCVQYLVGYGAKVHIAGPNGNTPLHLVLGKQDMKPLSEWSTYLNEFHEYVSGADNSIQDVPVYITVACFLVSEGASLDAVSHEGLTPFSLCPAKYHSLLKIFARPERKGHYRGSLPRHIKTERVDAQCDTSSEVTVPSCFLCEGPCDVTFKPCGHTAMCAECAAPVKKCPRCKTPIVDKVNT